MQTPGQFETAALEASRRPALGFVTSVRGADVVIDLPPGRARATVGRFVRIPTADSCLIGTLRQVSARDRQTEPAQTGWATGQLDVVGEIITAEDGHAQFRRGFLHSPAIGDAVELVGSRELDLVFGGAGLQTAQIGSLHQDPSVAAEIKVNEVLNKHFAVLGTTGVGKSSGVSILLHEMMQARPDLRVFLMDVHNEYGRCFGDRAHVVGSRTLKLPFWLFNFEELVDVIYGGRPPLVDETEILSELIPIARSTYGQYRPAERATVRRSEPKMTGFTVDTPVPYHLQDLLNLIDERMGRLDNRSMRMTYQRLMTRIETLRSDPRYAFMFQNANVGGDTMAELLVQLFRLEPDGKPMCVMQLAGMPDEVKDAVVCVLCRLAFQFGLWSEGAVPLLCVCEEAHRFASADHTTGFHPTRRALARIAKEGRKYGVFLGLVTQRPAELDPTILSQCSTLFAMRLTNDRDQALLRSAVSDASADLMSFVSSLGTREVIGFGAGVTLPTRMCFSALPPDRVPRIESSEPTSSLCDQSGEREFIRAVVDRWRGASLALRSRPEEAEPESAGVALPSARPAVGEALRYKLLKQPLTSDASDRAGASRLQR